MEFKAQIKPMSVNQAWQGRRFKSDAYKAYELELSYRLPPMAIPEPPYRITFEFGISKATDWDNPVKPLQDVLCKKYGFDDRDIYEGVVRKVVVKKGEEFFKFKLESIV